MNESCAEHAANTIKMSADCDSDQVSKVVMNLYHQRKHLRQLMIAPKERGLKRSSWILC